jgi:AcrR family transcriptional regulator
MINRERIIEAATRVYSLHGFRGATTRLIANEAGVNEVTLFRIFGSKAALLNEIAQRMSSEAHAGALPVKPRDPEREVTSWAATQLAHVWRRCSMIRKTMSEMEDRPDLCGCIAVGPTSAARQMRDYVEALQAAGMADADVDPLVPSAMLLGAIFADGMGRDFMPEIYPPADEAATLYARSFLRSIGAKSGVARKRRPLSARKRATSSRRKAS